MTNDKAKIREYVEACRPKRTGELAGSQPGLLSCREVFKGS